MTGLGNKESTLIDRFLAPWGKEIDLKTVDYTEGLVMLRITIREKNRFTLVDLDIDTAMRLVTHIEEWIQKMSRSD